MTPTQELTTIDTTEIDNQLVSIQSRYIDVVDKRSHDAAVDGIRQAKGFISAVTEFFEPFEKPLKAALDALRERKKTMTDAATAYMDEHRKRCAAWQEAEEKRIAAENAAIIEAQKSWTPLDDAPAPVADFTRQKAASNGAGLRANPWSIASVDEDALWAAAVADPVKYRQFWTPDVKALTAKARSQGKAFNVPGVVAEQKKTLSIR